MYTNYFCDHWALSIFVFCWLKEMSWKSLSSSSSFSQITFKEEHHKAEGFESNFLKMISDHIPTGKFADPALDPYIHFFLLLKSPILPCSSCSQMTILFLLRKQNKPTAGKVLRTPQAPIYTHEHECMCPYFCTLFILRVLVGCLHETTPSPLWTRSPWGGFLLAIIFFLFPTTSHFLLSFYYLQQLSNML